MWLWEVAGLRSWEDLGREDGRGCDPRQELRLEVDGEPGGWGPGGAGKHVGTAGSRGQGPVKFRVFHRAFL